MKIRNKISLSFFLVFAITLLVVGVVFDLYASNLVKKDSYSYLDSSNRARAEHIRTYIKEKEKTAVILAAASVYRDLLKEATTSPNYKVIKAKIDKRLARTIESDKDIHQTFIVDKNGIIVASSDIVELGVDKSKDDYFINGRNSVYFKSIYYSEVIKGPAYAVSAPVLDDDGTFLGVSVLRFSADDFYALVGSENGLGDTEENFIINKDYFFITPSRFLGDKVILKDKVETQNAKNCFNPKEIEYIKKNGYKDLAKVVPNIHIIQAKDYRGVDVTATYAYIPETGWCLITKVDTAQLLDYRLSLALIILLISLVALAFLIFVTGLLSRGITKPLSILSGFTDRIKKGDFNFKSEIKSRDEIGQLANSFDLMVEAVKKSRSNIEEKVREQTIDLQKQTEQLGFQKRAMLSILEDVQEEKNKTMLLARDLEKYKMAVDNASDQVIITDLEGIVLYGNKVTEKITGYALSDVVGKKAGILWHLPMPKEFYEKLWDTIKNKKETFLNEIQNKRKNGEIYTASISISPILDGGGNLLFFVGLERDITKEKEIDKAKTEFVSLASHQLRTPLSAINWYTEMLMAGDAGPLNDEQKKYLTEVAIGNERMVDLVNSLLNVSRLDLGTFIIEPEPTDISEIAKSVLGELKQPVITKKLKIEENYDQAVSAQFPADKKLLRIIFQNLLSNAVKYTKPEGQISVKILPEPKGTILGDKELKENSVVLSVSDTGMGIPDKQKDKVFSKLFRADNARETETEGTGLGLYIIKSIIDQSGGEVWFESKENLGTTFYIRFSVDGMKKKEGTKTLD